MSQLNVGLALIGGLVLLLSLGTGLLRSRGYPPSEQMVAVLTGVLAGPVGLDLLELTRLGDPVVVLEQVARLTVAIAVTSIALRLPPGYYRKHARTLAVVLRAGDGVHVAREFGGRVGHAAGVDVGRAPRRRRRHAD